MGMSANTYTQQGFEKHFLEPMHTGCVAHTSHENACMLAIGPTRKRVGSVPRQNIIRKRCLYVVLTQIHFNKFHLEV